MTMTQPLRVLCVEDSPADAELVRHELRRAGFDVQWRLVQTEPDFLAALESDLDIILSDYHMPDFCGLRALQLLRERGRDIPFIIISGAVGEDVATAAMRMGAVDYLLKDRLGRLGAAVANAMEVHRLRQSERRVTQQMRLQAATMEAAANGICITDRQEPSFM